MKLPESCVACSKSPKKMDIVLYNKYTRPVDSKYQNKIADIEKKLNSLPKLTPLIVCGDNKLPTLQ